MANRIKFYNGKKAVDLWGDDLDGWTVLSGDGEPTKESDYYKFIPTLYRAVQLRSNAVATMPFELWKGNRLYDTSADWQNKIGFLPNPGALFGLVESALIMTGSAYLFKERSQVAVKALRYHIPTSITPKINNVTGEVEYFERPVDSVTKKFETEDYIYFWPPDPFVEVGPAKNYPAQAALNACGVLYNIDLFANNYFQRGAIKAMILTVQGMPIEAERQRLVDWWKKVVAGIRNAFGAQVVNADSIKPVVVGEGMKELENVTLCTEKREDISIAVGIPMSILFANAANYATSEQDALNYLNQTVIPECEFIASVLNEHLFSPLGLKMRYLPETLDAMQADEADRAGALKQLTDAGMPLPLAMDILGYALTKEQQAMLDAALKEKEEKAEQIAEQMSAKPEPEEAPEMPEADPEDNSERMKADLEKWLRKAVKALQRGKSANVHFVSTYIPGDLMATISNRLVAATNEEQVSAAFEFVETVTQVPAGGEYDTVTALLTGIKLGVEALKAVE